MHFFQQKLLELSMSEGSWSGATLFFAAVSAPYATSCLTTSACPSLAAHISGESPCEHSTACIHTIDTPIEPCRISRMLFCAAARFFQLSKAVRLLSSCTILVKCCCLQFYSHAEGTADTDSKFISKPLTPLQPRANDSQNIGKIGEK